MPFKFFIVRDMVRNIIIPECCGLAVTAGNHILNVSRRLYQLNMNFEKDFRLYEVGSVSDSGDISLEVRFIEHFWDEWKTPESECSENVDNSDLK